MVRIGEIFTPAPMIVAMAGVVVLGRSESDSTIAGAAVLSPDELVTMIGREGAKLGVGVEFR